MEFGFNLKQHAFISETAQWDYENVYWIQFNLITFASRNLTKSYVCVAMKIYNKTALNLLQSSLFQIQCNAISAKYIELSSCWRTYTAEEPQLDKWLETVHSSLHHDM